MKAIIVGTDKPCKIAGWVRRREGRLMQVISLARLCATIKSYSPWCIKHLDLKISYTDDNATTLIVCEFSNEWEHDEIERFLDFMRNCKKISAAYLTLDPAPDTMPA
jgi:hypothetical protein